MMVKRTLFSNVGSLAWNLLLVYVCYFICRLTFLLTNWAIFGDQFEWGYMFRLFAAGTIFDTTAILYSNALFIVLFLFPFHWKERSAFYRVVRWVFVAVNTFFLISNLVDCVYFRFSGRRTTMSVFQEFSHEAGGNMTSIFLKEFAVNWYLVVLAIALGILLYKLFRSPRPLPLHGPKWSYYVVQTVSLLVVAPFVVFGMRGGMTAATRPITISNANQYADRPVDACLVLNTPFSLFRTLGKKAFIVPQYLSEEEAVRVYSPLHTPADSIQFRQIQVMADTEDKRIALADSIFDAIKGGADFAEIAKAYGQTGEAAWVDARSWEGAALDAENTTYIKTLINQPVNELKNLQLGQVNLILQVMNKKAMKPKYQVAVIKLPIEFSKETYSDAYNKFSQFVAQNTTLEDMKKNAEEAGYTVIPRSDFRSDEHYVGGIRSTQDALRWIFDAKEGEVSPLYECGENDHMMVVGLEAINKKGYVNINKVANVLKAEIIRDKKAEQLMSQMQGFNSLDQVKGMNDAVSDSVKHVTFGAPAYISVTHASEPAISAYASKAEVNKISAPIKGNAGVYMIQAYAKDNGTEEFDAKKEEASLSSMAPRYADQCIYELREKAKVTDQRYLYF